MAKIFWDKGHGGSDPGACGNGLQEKVLTHKIVEYAMAYVNANYDNVQQRTSRAGDETKSLSQRTNDANSWGADILISVHINSGSTSANGFESFTYTSPSAASISLQNVLHPEVFAVMKAWGINTDRGKKRANFHMVRESRMPAILTENLFISNTAESNRLKDEAFLKAVGEAHGRGVAKFLGLPAKPKETKHYFFYTGAYLGDALVKIHNYLKENKFWFEISTDANLNFFFNIGAFMEGSPEANKMENFLKENNFSYEKRIV